MHCARAIAGVGKPSCVAHRRWRLPRTASPAAAPRRRGTGGMEKFAPRTAGPCLRHGARRRRGYPCRLRGLTDRRGRLARARTRLALRLSGCYRRHDDGGDLRRAPASFMSTRATAAAAMPLVGDRQQQHPGDPTASGAGRLPAADAARRWLQRCAHRPSQRGPGEVAEWLIAPHSKCGILARVSGVRIPPSPPTSIDFIAFSRLRRLCPSRCPLGPCQMQPQA